MQLQALRLRRRQLRRLLSAGICLSYQKSFDQDQLSEIKNIFDLSNHPDQFSNEALEIFNYLMARKKWLFPEIKRMVLDYEFVETQNGFHLNVVSNFFGPVRH